MSAIAIEPRIIAPSVTKEKRPYKARGAALRLWGCRDDEILMDGPAGTGKTRAILEKIHYCCMHYPNIRCLLVRKTRESLTESVLVTYEEHVVQADSSILNGAKRNFRQSYHYPNGSVIVVGGMDKTQKVMSTEYNMIGTFESTELSLEDFEKLTTRLGRDEKMPYSQIISDCNPGAPTHWLNKRAMKPDVMTRLLSRHEDNPVLFDEIRHADGKISYVATKLGAKYIQKLSRLSGHRLMRLRYGKWVAAEGVVYPEYDEQIHLIDRFPIPQSWRRIRVIDFGYTNPFVCQWWAIDGDGNMYRYREIYHTRRLVADHAKQIVALSAGEKIETDISDHDAEDRATADNAGLITNPAHKPIKPGIEAVQERLRKQGPHNRPRIFLLRDSLVEVDPILVEAGLPLCTEQEFDGYVYPEGQDGKPLKEEPVDKDNHGMDTTRYAVAYVDDIASMMVQMYAEEPQAFDAPAN